MKYFYFLFAGLTLLQGCSKIDSIFVPANSFDSVRFHHHSITTIKADAIPVTITLFAGDQQAAPKGFSLSSVLQVLVKNKEGNPIQGVSISFSPAAGSGQVSWDTISTDQYGLASFYWKLDPQANPDEVVIAKVVSNANLSVSFHAVGLEYNLYHFVGTFVLDSAISDPSIILSSIFPTYSNNETYPLVMDSIMYTPAMPAASYPCKLEINNYRFKNSNASLQDMFHISANIIQANQRGEYNTTRTSLQWKFNGILNGNTLAGEAILTTSKITSGSSQTTFRRGTFTAVLK